MTVGGIRNSIGWPYLLKVVTPASAAGNMALHFNSFTRLSESFILRLNELSDH